MAVSSITCTPSLARDARGKRARRRPRNGRTRARGRGALPTLGHLGSNNAPAGHRRAVGRAFISWGPKALDSQEFWRPELLLGKES